MKRFRRILTVFAIILLLGSIFFLRAAIWQQPLVTVLNQKVLNPKGWQLSLSKISGHLLTTIKLNKADLIKMDGTHLQVENGRIQVNWLSCLSGSPHFFLVDLKGIDLELPENSNHPDSAKNFRPEIPSMSINIKDLRLSGQVRSKSDTSVISIPFSILGQAKVKKQKAKLTIETLDVRPPVLTDTLSFYNTVLTLSPTELTGFPLNINWGSATISGEIKSQLSDRSTEGSLSFNPVDMYSIFPKLKLPDSTFRYLGGGVSFKSKGEFLKGSFELTPVDKEPVHGRLVLEHRSRYWVVDTLNVSRRDSRVAISAATDSLNQFNALVYLKPFHIQDWTSFPFHNSLEGSIQISGQVQPDSSVAMTASFNINETEWLNASTLISGTISYKNNLINMIEPLFITQTTGRIQISGSYNMNSNIIDAGFEAKNLDLSPFRNLTNGAMGNISGTGHVSGNLEHPEADADVTLDQGQFKDFTVTNLEWVGHVSLDSIRSAGSAHFTANDLKWRTQSADHATGDFQLNGNTITFENIHVSRDQDYIQISGSADRNGEFTFDRLQAAYEGHLLISPKPIKFSITSEGIRTKPIELHVDDGIVSGVIKKEKYLDLQLKITNISSELVSKFIPDKRLKFTGIMFGEMGIDTRYNDPKVSIDVSLKNGSIAGEKFDDLVMSGLLERNILHLDEIAMTRDERTRLQVSGIVPLKSDSTRPVPIDLAMHFKQFRLESLTQFIPNFFDISGIVSGDFDLGGSPVETNFKYDLAIENSTFDKLNLGQVTGDGFYRNHRWTMTHYTSVKKDQILEGNGFLPIVLDVGSKELGHWIKSDSLYIDVKGHRHDLNFLSAYISDLDSARGDFNLELVLSGKPEKIIRDGSMVITNGRLYTPLLDNPIRHINSHISIADNLLYIQNFSGVMRQKSSESKPNLNVTGEIDLTQFFHPRYNIKAKGKQIFFSSLAEDMSGNVDVNISVVGRDTITIAGTIPVNQVVLTKEFVTETAGSIPEKQGGTIPYYKITFPITGSLNLVNQQIDANLGGEVSLSQLGNEETNYAGELYVKDGRFFYSGGIFKKMNGTMSFDGKGFNPILDFTAQQTIEDQIIYLQLTGPLDNPRFDLTSSGGFSQSDILQLLLYRKLFTPEDLTSTGLGTQAQAILTAWFESQLEKNLMEFSGLNRLGIVKDVSISGLDPSSSEDLTIKADLSQKVSLNYAYQRSFSLTNNPNHKLGVEYKINRYFSVVGNVDQTGNFQAKYRLRYSY